jgi:3-polyprenyl-4-hydroxybenzoate decarboxylase
MLTSTVAWRNLGAYVKGLEEAGKLVRVTVPINKDTELHPLVRLQFRGLPESERKAFLFENVYDARGKTYDIPVLIAALAGSAEIYSLGMGCPISELDNEWQEALAHPLDPVHVDEAPCQEVRIMAPSYSNPAGA